MIAGSQGNEGIEGRRRTTLERIDVDRRIQSAIQLRLSSCLRLSGRFFRCGFSHRSAGSISKLNIEFSRDFALIAHKPCAKIILKRQSCKRNLDNVRVRREPSAFLRSRDQSRRDATGYPSVLCISQKTCGARRIKRRPVAHDRERFAALHRRCRIFHGHFSHLQSVVQTLHFVERDVKDNPPAFAEYRPFFTHAMAVGKR
jgi:hypothetical protein